MGGFNPDWANAIASIESAGSGGYSAMGPTTRKGNRAYGRYQVMDFNIPSWTKKHLGRELTPQQFLNDEAAQDSVFQGEFGSYVNKYGNPQDAASAWFTGKPLSGGAGRSDILGTTGSKYVNKFNAAMGGGVAADAMQVLGKTLPQQRQRGILATPQKGPEPMQKQQPRGLLGSMGIQKMQEGAEGETGQRFFQRDSFKDTAAKMGQAFAALGSNPAVQKFTNDVANQRTETKSRNKTIEYLRANGMGNMADMVEAGDMSAGGVMSAIMQNRMAVPKKSAKEQQIARIMESGNVSREVAVKIVDGVIVVSRDPTTGEAVLLDKSAMGADEQNFGVNPPSEITTTELPPQTTLEDASGANAGDAFGAEGFAKGVVNNFADALGRNVPYPQVEQNQAAFDVLRETITNDIASSYGRTPPSWLLKKIQDLTPEAGKIWNGASGAKTKLKAIQDSLQVEMDAIKGALSRPMSASDREAYLVRRGGIEAALGRIDTANKSFGTSQSNVTGSGVKWEVVD